MERVATTKAVNEIVRTALLALPYSSVITTTPQFPCLVFVKGQNVAIATNSRGPIGGNECNHRWLFLEELCLRQGSQFSMYF